MMGHPMKAKTMTSSGATIVSPVTRRRVLLAPRHLSTTAWRPGEQGAVIDGDASLLTGRRHAPTIASMSDNTITFSSFRHSSCRQFA